MLRLSQTELANELGLTFQQVQKYEKGINRVSASRLQQTAEFLQVPVSFFFERPAEIDANFSGIDPFLDPSLIRDLLALARAFNAIADSRMRKAITVLVEVSASTVKNRRTPKSR